MISTNKSKKSPTIILKKLKKNYKKNISPIKRYPHIESLFIISVASETKPLKLNPKTYGKIISPITIYPTDKT